MSVAPASVRPREPGGSADDWILRWDTARDSGPCLEHPNVLRSPAGRLVFIDGYLFETTPEQAAAGFDRIGDRLLDDLRGGYVLVVWDPRRHRLLVARDAMGLRTCFYTWEGGHLTLAADIDALVRRAPFNRTVIAEYLTSRHPLRQSRETFYEGVLRLPPAHALSVSGGTLSVSRYWDPLPAGFRWAEDPELAQFAPTFDRAVGRVVAAGADSIALSGGFDSVSVAVAAARRGRQLHALSLRFTDPTCDEGPSQTAVARALGLPHTVRTVRQALDGGSCVEASLALSASSPCPVLSLWQAVYTGLLRAARDTRRCGLVLGTGGDDLFNVDLSYGLDRARDLDLAGLWRFYRSWQRTSPFSALRVARAVLWSGAARPALATVARRFRRRHRDRPPRFRCAPGSRRSWLAPSWTDTIATPRGRSRRPRRIPATSARCGVSCCLR